jgi:hypothetical protein
MADTKKTSGTKMSEGQRAYEAKRAAKAGKPLDSWIDDKRKRREKEQEKEKVVAPKKPGLITRLLDRAHKPLKP